MFGWKSAILHFDATSRHALEEQNSFSVVLMAGRLLSSSKFFLDLEEIGTFT